MGKARRYNKGKLRYELIPQYALSKLAEVYTKGAEKYTLYNEDGTIKEDGANNWRSGLSWIDTISSVSRHIEAWKSGEDLDPDLGTFHLSNAAWGLFSILEYYKIYPEGDDRPHTYLQNKKIGLDIDEVICDWMNACRDLYGIEETITSWYFDRNIQAKFNKMRDNNTLDDFYMSLKPLLKPEDIPFEPHCYITSRPVEIEVTQKWLDLHGFPHRPIYSVGSGKSKVDAAKEAGIDIFVDDNYNNFVELNKAGICTFLYDKPHNARYPVGYKRIKSLKELI